MIYNQTVSVTLVAGDYGVQFTHGGAGAVSVDNATIVSVLPIAPSGKWTLLADKYNRNTFFVYGNGNAVIDCMVLYVLHI